ncbi:50S ribosomal protein L23 [Candidatus Peregrinibacteria bacterium CG11_big_fil_rev_8_21_14_0_20_41_10]|nr:MAG: 50S ribosomal protein L23 [Candidatus Peregrinibacteria bacterium CG11_big_fil_rev_8_21_14_0_20_41_10]PIZ76760.1 MAG: 50S ribosomal protein L23 [Candidatus Peregrinibacteria bacterium CG_4_10_14_0_2_um_filter_41_8]PJC37963.1 MAG: 50S ribosomal protein L23 [Candidatus Peregrinibacteria bacterium CG_4_9_14_0_2_um_filter_41_14]
MQTNYIIKPVVTEKSVSQGEANKFTFLVRNDATKVAISQQLIEIYGVVPTKVNMQKLPAKHRTAGRQVINKRKAHKRAIVTFPANSNIDLFKTKAKK